MGSLKLTTASSGSVILSPANTASDVTITVPAVTGTMLTTASTFAGTGPAFSAYMSGNQTITTSTWTKLTLNTEEFDTNSCYDSSTNYRFTPTVAGYYQVNGKLVYDPIEAGKISIVSIYKNGSRFKDGSRGLNNVNGNGVASMVSSIVYFNGSTDYIELYAFNTNTTSASATGASAFETFFNAAMVRAA